ncbi:hypothetical protein [Sphingobium sp. HWE2-09]|uniref:hypothetical protein n=1 Tax=Sphingobium sp. HWE2-09 TaxID=3108390 RepID=UPI002DC0BF63|nr:hypothetical protein [Sphingobium sp. HWE2-09]
MRSLAERFDNTIAYGRAMIGFASVWTQVEAETTSERAQRGKDRACAPGTSGTAPALRLDTETEIVAALSDGAQVHALAQLYGVAPATIKSIRARGS